MPDDNAAARQRTHEPPQLVSFPLVECDGGEYPVRLHAVEADADHEEAKEEAGGWSGRGSEGVSATSPLATCPGFFHLSAVSFVVSRFAGGTIARASPLLTSPREYPI